MHLVKFFFFQCSSKENGKKEMLNLAIASFVIPGDAGFPLNAMYSKPSSKAEAGTIIQIFALSHCLCSVENIDF